MSRPHSDAIDATLVRLLLASFVVALATTGFIFAVPFYILAKFGRTDIVGLVVAAWTFGYIVSCLLAQFLAFRFSPRVLVTFATAGVSLFVFLFRLTATVPQMLMIGLGYGLCLGLFWAPLMGWLSGEAEGVSLSRRLGLFNIAWSSSIVIAPLIAGYLVKQSLTLPFGVMAGVMAVACLLVLTTRCHRRPASSSASSSAGAPAPADHAESFDPAKMRYIRFLAWTGAAVAYMAIAVYRYQMPHLAETLHMDKVVFGVVATALSLAITIAFFILGRWSGWHGRTRWIFLPQLLLVAVSVLLTFSASAWTMAPLMLAAGLCAGMLYASSVFHGSLGAAPAVRTRRMAVHEIALNLGVITGSYFGNLLSQYLGPSRVYPYLAAAIALAVIVQAAGWRLLLARGARRPSPAFQAVQTSVSLNPVLTRQE